MSYVSEMKPGLLKYRFLADCIHIPLPGILILNKADRHANIRAEDIQASIKHPVASQIPLDERTATTAANQGVPFVMSAGSTPVAQATMALGRYVIGALAEKADVEEVETEKAAAGRMLR